MEGGGGSREQNYWPAFVDALSNVVLTLVFVLVIFVFALAMASSKVGKKIQTITEAEQMQKTANQKKDVEALREKITQQNTELQMKLDKALTEIQMLQEEKTTEDTKKKDQGIIDAPVKPPEEAPSSTITVLENKEARYNRGAVAFTQKVGGIVLNYPVSVAEMDEKSKKSFEQILETEKRKPGKVKILVRSIIGAEPYSAARRLAYYRAINARNYILAKGVATSPNINTTIIQPPVPVDGHVEIIFQRQ